MESTQFVAERAKVLAWGSILVFRSVVARQISITGAFLPELSEPFLKLREVRFLVDWETERIDGTLTNPEVTGVTHDGTKWVASNGADLFRYGWMTSSVSVRPIFQLPTFSAPSEYPMAISVNRVRPRHITILPGAGSRVRAR